jgi:hypothetical protein
MNLVVETDAPPTVGMVLRSPIGRYWRVEQVGERTEGLRWRTAIIAEPFAGTVPRETHDATIVDVW